jgi:uncharacterized protein YjbI with pentapeptide repeats
MNQIELDSVIKSHQLWLAGIGGVKANLSKQDLTGLNLSGVNLSWANFHRAILNKADLSKANLSGCNLTCSKLVCADIRGTNLSQATLYKVDFRGVVTDLKKHYLNRRVGSENVFDRTSVKTNFQERYR